jgi:hypothetical protein
LDAADIVRDTNALSIVALALGLAEADSKYKKSASNIIVAAKHFAAAENLDTGKKAYEGLKSALTNTTAGTPLSWSEKTVDLAPLMKALPSLSAGVKRITGRENTLTAVLDRRPNQVYGPLAALAVISQGSVANAAETNKPDAATEWKKFCEEFRDAALKANATAHLFAEKQADYATYEASLKAMIASCDSCHEVFSPNSVGKAE